MKLVFPFYESVGNQFRYRQSCKQRGESFSLIAPHDRFLPFIIKRDLTSELITCVKVRRASDDVVAYYINVENFSYKLFTTQTHEYIVYYGATIEGFAMACNQYYLDIDGSYSEVFKALQDLSPFIKVSFTNPSSIGGILYQTGFEQIVYLDADIEQSEPFREEEGDEDGFGNFYPTFQKLIYKYSFSSNLIPEYLLDALLQLPLHKGVDIVSPEYEFENIRRIEAKPSFLPGCLSYIDFTFEENLQIISKDCVAEEELTEVDQAGYQYKPWLCDPSIMGPWEADPDTAYCLISTAWEADPATVYCVQDV